MTFSGRLGLRFGRRKRPLRTKTDWQKERLAFMKHGAFFCTAKLPLRRSAEAELCIGAEELVAAGVPARKAQRVLEELRRQAAAEPALNRRPVLLKLGRRIARFLL